MVLLAVFWFLYYILHSVLATLWVKSWVARHWPRVFRFYRLAYNQLSVWLFMAIVRYQVGLAAPLLWPRHAVLTLVGAVLLLLGMGVAVLALRGYDLGEFAGWRYVRQGVAAADTPLQTQGMNRLVRHPLYLGILLVLLGIGVLAPTRSTGVFVGCAALYVLVGSQLEERKLLARFGPAYARYQGRVPRLWPRIGAASRP